MTIYINIEDGINIYTISKKAEVTYKTAFDYVKLLEEKKLIILKKERNQQTIKLTEKGIKLQIKICDFYQYL